MELGSKAVFVEVEVIDGPLDYNILLGHTWVYAIAIIIWNYFRIITFPHKHGIVAIDQLTFFTSDSNVTGSVPLVGESLHSYQHVGVALLKDSSSYGKLFAPSSSPSQLLPFNFLYQYDIILYDPS